jgi:hypothetical protein
MIVAQVPSPLPIPTHTHTHTTHTHTHTHTHGWGLGARERGREPGCSAYALPMDFGLVPPASLLTSAVKSQNLTRQGRANNVYRYI